MTIHPQVVRLLHRALLVPHMYVYYIHDEHGDIYKFITSRNMQHLGAFKLAMRDISCTFTIASANGGSHEYTTNQFIRCEPAELMEILL